MTQFLPLLIVIILVFTTFTGGACAHATEANDKVDIITMNSATSTKNAPINSYTPIVFVYSLPAYQRDCEGLSLPNFLLATIDHVLATQLDYNVYFITNAVHCKSTIEAYSVFQQRFFLIDSEEIISHRSRLFENNTILGDAEYGLYTTSIMRFFILEDFMMRNNFTTLLHMEGDNIYYAPMTLMEQVLRDSYKVITVQPLTVRSLCTATILWVPTLETLHEFTDFLLELMNTSGELFTSYRGFNKNYCKHDRNCVHKVDGVGLALYSINEMSILAFYKHARRDAMAYFPVLPQSDVIKRDLRMYIVNGSEVGHDTLGGVWDPGSWGQFIDGKSPSRKQVVFNEYPRNKKPFINPYHIVGAAIARHGCNVVMGCSDVLRVNISSCLTAPFVSCGVNGTQIPLWNLHIHSKRTFNYKSVPCVCTSTASSDQ